MKNKKAIKSIEKAVELVNTLKAHAEIIKKNGQDISFIKTLDASVRKIERSEKEIVTLKERLAGKKEALKQEKELALELYKEAKSIAKKELGKSIKPEKKISKENVKR